jgi:hypothetical protein
MEKLSFSLPAEVAEKYEVVNTTSPVLESRIGKIDFRTISIAQAEKLVAAGTRYLVAKPTPKSK